MGSKGQVWSTDFTAGALTFVFMLMLFAIAWVSLESRWHYSSEYRLMQTDALFASEALVSTAGSPYGWESLPSLDDARGIGLCGERGVIDPAKLSRLAASNGTDYYLIKERLGVQRYELHGAVTGLDGEATLAEFGLAPSGQNASVTLERMVIYGGAPAILRLEVWR